MAIKLLNPLSDEEMKKREDITEMSVLIIAEMKKRGLTPDDTSSLLSEIENQMYKNTKMVWDENNQ